MSLKAKSTAQVMAILLFGVMSAISVAAQSAPASLLEDQLTTQFKITRMGIGASGPMVLQAGNVFVVQSAGLVGVSFSNPVTCPSKFQDGNLQAPNRLCVALLNARNAARDISAGEKVYITKIEVVAKNDKVEVQVVECDSCNGVSAPSSYKSEIAFQFPKGYLAAADAGQVADVISQALPADTGSVGGSQAQNQQNQQQDNTETQTPQQPGGQPEPVSTSQAAQVTEPASNSLVVTSQAQCTGPGDATITNNTHGTIRVLSGTGAFSAVSASNKRITVSPAGTINGTLNFRVLNNGPGFAVAPLIWTPSWGDDSTSWRLVSQSVQPGQQDISVQIAATAPQNPGVYHIVLALQLETNGASVASGTNWAVGQPIWGDGNDIAEFNSKQISEGQKYGCTIDNWLVQEGLHPFYIPSDAITVKVVLSAGSPPNTSLLLKPVQGGVRAVDFRNFEYRPGCLDKQVIRVTNGDWKEVEDNETNYFHVVSVTYGNLEGSGQEQAVVLGACGGVANFEIGDILVYSMSANGPNLIAELSPNDWGKGEEDNGSDFQISDLKVSQQELTISFLAGGFHACSAWIITARYRWDGHNLVRVGSALKPNPCNVQH
jgi:hypothetical protein